MFCCILSVIYNRLFQNGDPGCVIREDLIESFMSVYVSYRLSNFICNSILFEWRGSIPRTPTHNNNHLQVTLLQERRPHSSVARRLIRKKIYSTRREKRASRWKKSGLRESSIFNGWMASDDAYRRRILPDDSAIIRK